MPTGKELDSWNIYSPLWAPVAIEKMADSTKVLSLKDWDRFDYAKAERLVPSSKKLLAEFSIVALQNNHGNLDIEFQDAKGTPGIRLSFDSVGAFTTKAGYRNKNIMQYKPGETYKIAVELDTDTRFFSVTINDKKELPGALFFAPLDAVERIVFRTGDTRRFPDADTPTDPMYEALPHAGEAVQKAGFLIKSLITRTR